MQEIIKSAIAKKQEALSEYESKRVLEMAGIPVAKQGLVRSKEDALGLAREIGYPVVMKGCSDKLTHKTELGLVKLNIVDADEVSTAYEDLISKAQDMDGVLVMEMITGIREFVVGLSRDPQFGPYVMFGLGGVFTEALNDVSFRIAPLRRFDAKAMIREIKAQKLLGAFRGQPAVDLEALADILISVGRVGIENEAIAEIDINPLILRDEMVIAADALVVLRDED